MNINIAKMVNYETQCNNYKNFNELVKKYNTRRLKMLKSISKVKEMVLRDKYICSDGKEFFNAYEAIKHERLIKITEIFSGVASVDGRMRGTHRFFFTRHFALEEGVYHVVLRDQDDLETLDSFFEGLDEMLGYPEEFPIEIDIDIYFDKEIKDVVAERCNWRLYNPKDYDKGKL